MYQQPNEQFQQPYQTEDSYKMDKKREKEEKKKEKKEKKEKKHK
jgi:hypothetical protein